MTQPTAAIAKLVDKSNNPQIGDRQSAITALTDNTGGTANNTLENLADGSTYANDHSAIENNFADLAAKVNELIEALEAHGLIADN
jgi:hypothetical protein